ncbi:MAG: hypothetical protein EBQ95_04920, partial [Gammaproteobacteria bacterium]|nr:hypothetical protein [Gammaproteobacteria bacterium]
EDWKNQNNSTILSKRIEKTAELIAQVQSPCIIHVEGSNISSHEELMNFYSQCMSKGYEGIMVKSINSSYAFKRSNSVLKLKPVSTAELMIVGHYKGTRGSKREELWGGFEALGVNGIVTRVGGGFNDKIRAEIQTGGPDSYIGNIIECEYQPDPLTADGFTVDGKLRFPVFVRFRDNSDVDDNLIKAGVEFLKKIKTQVQ